MTADTASGRCLCGGVAFTMRLPSKWLAHCHCSYCQRAHGAAFVTWVGADEAGVAIFDPDGRLTSFASSPGAERGFCSHCGSSLFPFVPLARRAAYRTRGIRRSGRSCTAGACVLGQHVDSMWTGCRWATTCHGSGSGVAVK